MGNCKILRGLPLSSVVCFVSQEVELYGKAYQSLKAIAFRLKNVQSPFEIYIQQKKHQKKQQIKQKQRMTMKQKRIILLIHHQAIMLLLTIRTKKKMTAKKIVTSL